MENQNSALNLPIGSQNSAPVQETVSVVQTVEAPVRTVKCKPGQGKLNRMIAKVQVQLNALGYPAKRFKRDYEAGTASYTCPISGKSVFINIHTKEVTGDALTTAFVAPTTGANNG